MSYSSRNILWNVGVTGKLIIVNAVVYFVFLILQLINPNIIDYLALKPANIFQGKMLWTVFTSMFLHANIGHLFVNMMSLFFVGNFVERIIGRKRFFVFYILSGIAAGLSFVFLSLVFRAEYSVYAVGASGAIFALGSLLMVIIPRLPVLLFFVIPMPLWLGMLFLMFGLWAISLAAGLPIGNTAHFGGFIIGLIYGLYLKEKYKRKVKLLRMYFER